MHDDIIYPINYGTAIIHRKDDVEDKWVVTPKGAQYIKDEIAGQVKFQEQYFDTVIERKELNVGVVITAFTKGEKYPQNSAFVIDRNGEIILKYSKVHTCDFDWERYLESGQEFKVCEFDGVKIGVMICYDREYPESARELMLQGAEIIFNPNCCGGMEPRLKELSVRAMENMVGVAMANPPAEGMGRSCAFSPMVWGENGDVLDNTMIVAEEYYEGIVYAEFDMDKIREYREREYLGKFRKPKAYKHWGK